MHPSYALANGIWAQYHKTMGLLIVATFIPGCLSTLIATVRVVDTVWAAIEF